MIRFIEWRFETLEIEDRVSEVLRAQLQMLFENRLLDFFNSGSAVYYDHVIDCLSHLEEKSISSTKAATAFKRDEELKGLWHKHILEAGNLSLNRNLIKTMQGTKGVKRMVAGISDSPTAQQFSHRMISRLQNLSSDKKMTGEWLIFEKLRDGQNYYHTIAAHYECPAEIAKRIDRLTKDV